MTKEERIVTWFGDVMSEETDLRRNALYALCKLGPKELDRLRELVELAKNIPHVCRFCVGCEMEPKDGHGCDEYDSVVFSTRYLRELVEADWEGRCVVLPSGGYCEKDGENALKSAMNTCYYHNNPVIRYIADAVAEKLTREEAKAALKGERDE